MEIGGLQKTTLIDYPGRLAAVAFLLGCNFRCPFCYSAELVLPEKMLKQPRLLEKNFFAFLEGRKGLLQGVVICGGEPTINLDLPQFLEKIKKLGYLVKLDTNGSNPEMLQDLLKRKLVDYIAMDIKAPFAKYKAATGGRADLAKVKKSIDLIKNSGVDYEFRTTVVPTVHDKEDIIQLAKEIAPARKYFLQGFRAEKTLDGQFEKIKGYPREFLEEIKKEIEQFFEICEVRA
jgi:pyruvate formate lyase activating enzyme